jgi:hypothetical protein
MLKLISGELVGGTKYSDMYVTSNIKEDDTLTASNNRSSNTVNITAITSTEKFQHCRKLQEKLQG